MIFLILADDFLKKVKDPALLPGNVAKNTNVQELQERWKCDKQQETCVGTYCYPHPKTKDHIPLNHERLDCWALAMVSIYNYVVLFTS